MNSDLSSDDDRQDVSTTVIPPINSKLDVKRPILETKQHDRKTIRKKLKVIMTGRVIMTTEKGRQKISLSNINRKRRHESGDLLGKIRKKDFCGFQRTSTSKLSPIGNKTEYLEEQLASRPVPEKANTKIQLCPQLRVFDSILYLLFTIS